MSSGDRDFPIEIGTSFSIPHTDIELMRLKLGLTPGQRLIAMLEARALIVGLIRGRLMQERPELSAHEIGLLVIEEIERTKRHEFGPPPIFPRSAED